MFGEHSTTRQHIPRPQPSTTNIVDDRVRDLPVKRALLASVERDVEAPWSHGWTPLIFRTGHHASAIRRVDSGESRPPVQGVRRPKSWTVAIVMRRFPRG